ncbi:MAG: prepilin-type N-terminal cleavage/methylation domain-containing protein [Patescibacteria group bacterium]|nr:prepilin-type N-terminal cleavage/methylation domain-containing protein [Patescibacteria group bacterium]
MRIAMKKARGFTLIELLVVIAIIAILASIILASLNTARSKSRDARRVSDIQEVRTALELYNNDFATYPAVASYSALTSYLVPNYIAAMPADPEGGSYAYAYQALASVASTSSTCSSTPCPSYVLRVQLENDNVSILNGSVTTGTIGGVDCSQSPNYYYCIRP